jgi:carnitine 3-dehydrogenase
MQLNNRARRVAVVGTGVIGSSWAALYLARGFDVIATDPRPDAESHLRHFIDTAWEALAVLGLSPKASPDHIDFTPDLKHAVSSADFIQENAPDQEQVKMQLFAAIDAAAPADSIIASSSSGIAMSTIQSLCRYPQRCVIGRPLNPPHIIPLVEVAGGEKTAPEAIQQALGFYASAGKQPIHLRKEIAGGAADRVQAALHREMAYLIDQGVLDVADADAAVCWGHGLRWGVMGPNLALHLGERQDDTAGLNERIASHWKRLGNLDLTPELRQAIRSGVLQAVEQRNFQQVARERDELLVGLLRLRERYSNRFARGRSSNASKRR